MTSSQTALRSRIGIVLHRGIRRALEGEYAWGAFSVAPAARTTWTHYRLTVYPPGTSSTERRLLTVRSAWPAVGAGIALAMMLILSSVASPTETTATALFVYVGGTLLAHMGTARTWPRVRRIIVVVIGFGDRTEIIGDHALLTGCLTVLRDADRRLRLGTMTPVQYEAAWAGVYERMPAPTSRRAGREIVGRSLSEQ